MQLLTFYKYSYNTPVKLVDANLPVPPNATHKSIYYFGDDNFNDQTIRWGNFKIDTDNNDVVIAKNHTLDLLNHFETRYGLDLACVKIFASGGKGFHLSIPAQCFGAIPIPNLPAIYKVIAQQLLTETRADSLDLNLYKMGRGQGLRLAGRVRENGLYKVQITLEELKAISCESDYMALCQNPRQGWEVAEPKEVAGLVRSFNDASALCELNAKEQIFGCTQGDLKVLGGVVPKCVANIIAGENLNRDDSKGNFNSAKQSLARLLLNVDLPEPQKEEAIKTFAENFPSTRHPTPAQREAETRIALKTMRGKEFSCGYMKAVLDKSPCSGCPLRKTSETKAKWQKLANKISTNKGHISAIVSAMTEAKGADWDKLAVALVLCLAKGVPAKQGVDDAVEFAVGAGVGEEQARDVIQAAADERLAKARTQNNITNFEGVKRVDVSGLSHEQIVGLMLDEMDLSRVFKGILGELEEVQVERWERGFDENGNKIREVVKETVLTRVKPTLKTFLLNLPMGFGKTEIASLLHKKIQTEMYRMFSDYRGSLPKREGNRLKFADYSMLATFVAHRVSLIKGASERFDVADYQNIESKRDFRGNFATCVDSIWQFEPNQILIVDEAKQTTEHLASSDTVGSGTKIGRRGIFDSFVNHVKSAVYSIFMDADLNDETVDFIKAHGAGREIVLFECQPNPHKAKHTILSNGHDEARTKALELLEQGKRGTLAATSEKQAARTFHYLRGRGFRVLLLTGENKGSTRQKAFLQNPTKESENYDLIIYSPVIGSGVSIVNENLTFAILLNSCVVPANEAWQMLARNRCASEIYISFDKSQNYEKVTDPEILIEAVKEQILENLKADCLDKGLDCAEFEVKITELTKLQARITAKRNDDMNDFDNRFVALGLVQGRAFKYTKVKKVSIPKLKAETLLEIAERRLNAEIIDDVKAKELEEKPETTQKESDALTRFKVVEMVGAPTIELSDVEGFEKNKNIVANVETLFKPETDLKEIDAHNRKTLNKNTSKLKEKQIFEEVFSLLTDKDFGTFFSEPDTQIGVLDFEKGLEICKVFRRHHKALSHLRDYSKLPKDPVKVAGNFLEKYGISTAKAEGKTARKYPLFLEKRIASYTSNRAALRGADIQFFCIKKESAEVLPVTLNLSCKTGAGVM